MLGKNAPFISLGQNWKVVCAHDEIKENYSGLLAPGFFADLLSEYSSDYFDKPVVMSAPGADLADIRLVFVKEDDLVKCFPVKSEIYAGMAQRNVDYQMREPITSLFALMPVLTDNINKGDGPKAFMNLEQINRQSYKLLKNVTNMSVVSRIMGGNIFEKDTVNLSSLVESLSSAVVAVEKNTAVHTEVEKNIFIRGNTQLLTNGILNLISNSINFRSDENVNIEIKLKKEGNNAVLSYKDNSKGIKDEYLTQVFRPYFSKDPYADGESDPSLGLGLYIAKAAFEQAGGKVMLTSSFGNGVRYSVSIPLENDIDNVLENSSTDFLLNRYSELFVQLCDSCRLPELK